MLHYGGIPDIDLATWKFSIVGLVEEEVHFTWDEFMALPQTTLRSDIHCVTHWSKFDNDWTGVQFTDLMAQLKREARSEARDAAQLRRLHDERLAGRADGRRRAVRALSTTASR